MLWPRILGAAVAMWLVSEIAHTVASRSGLGDSPRTGPTTVLVLGFRDRGPSANGINRWRVRAALRSGGHTFIMSGGAPSGADVTEASLLACYAESVGADPRQIVHEDASRSTWENIVNSIPLLEGADRIIIVSDPLHALKARWYLARLRPDLAARLVRADDQRWGERAWLKPLLSVVEGTDLIRAWARNHPFGGQNAPQSHRKVDAWHFLQQSSSSQQP